MSDEVEDKETVSKGTDLELMQGDAEVDLLEVSREMRLLGSIVLERVAATYRSCCSTI